MTQTSNRLLDEFAKLMTDAAGVAQGVQREAGTMVRSQAERFLSEMDLVQREEFEAVKEMAANARIENQELKDRIETLETKLSEFLAQSEKVSAKPAASKRKTSRPTTDDAKS